MKSIILTTAIVAFQSAIFNPQSAMLMAQNYQWANSIGSPYFEFGRGIVSDDTGNVYIAGYFQDIADFNPGIGTNNLASAGGDDIFLAKYNSSGQFVWAENIGNDGNERVYEMTSDGYGNFFVAGIFTDTTDFDPGPGIATIFPAGSGNIFFARYDANGYFVWVKNIGSTSTTCFCEGITLDDSGNVFIAGYFSGTADFDPGPDTAFLTATGSPDLFFAKYNSNGEYLWAKATGGSPSGTLAMDIAVHNTGDIFLTGDFYATADFDPGPGTALLTSIGNSDIFIARYTSSGLVDWVSGIGGTGSDQSRAIAIDATGYVYATGFFNGTVDFDPGAGIANLSSAGGPDIFLAKYNYGSGYEWAKRFGSSSTDAGHKIILDDLSDIYLTGEFMSVVDFDPGAGSANVTSKGAADIFFAKYNSSGSYVWAKGVGGTNSDYCYSVNLDNSGNLLLTGSFRQTVDFDPGPGIANLYAIGNDDIFFAKYSGTVTANEEKPFTPLPSSAFMIFPNPANNEIEIDLNAQYLTGKIFSISLLNTLCQYVWHQQMTEAETRITVSGFPKGLYILKISLENELLYRKVVVE